MSQYVKPQSPIRIEDTYIYPLTTADQVMLENGERLNSKIYNCVGLDTEDGIISEPNPVNADTLGGKPENELSVAKAIDSDTLGGKQASEYATNDYVNQQVKKAAPRNLLDNSDFTNTVNQRGDTSSVAPSVSVIPYFIDRWNIYGGGATFDISDKKLRITNDGSATCGFLQRVSSENLTVGKVYTLAFKAIVTGTKWYLSYGTNATNNEDSSEVLEADIRKIHIFTFTLSESSTDVFNFRIRCSAVEGTAEIEWAALYEGEYTADTLPEYQPKGYGAELAECQRYYVRFASTDDMVAFSGGSNNQYGYFQIPLPVPMRSGVVPTVNYENVNIYGLTAGSAVDITGLTCYFTNFNNALLVRATHEKNAFDSQTPVMLRIRAGGYIELNADL